MAVDSTPSIPSARVYSTHLRLQQLNLVVALVVGCCRFSSATSSAAAPVFCARRCLTKEFDLRVRAGHCLLHVFLRTRRAHAARQALLKFSVACSLSIGFNSESGLSSGEPTVVIRGAICKSATARAQLKPRSVLPGRQPAHRAVVS